MDSESREVKTSVDEDYDEVDGVDDVMVRKEVVNITGATDNKNIEFKGKVTRLYHICDRPLIHRETLFKD